MIVRAPLVVPFGDRALLVTTDDVAAAHALAGLVTELGDGGGGIPGARPAPGPIDEVVVGFATVLVALGPDPATADLGEMAAWLGHLVGTDAVTAFASARPDPAVHELPVVFDGADLVAVAAAVGASVDRVVDLLVTAELRVAFVGFAPGFPYLVGLPDELAALPRRTTPRTRVPGGSVAVAGGFASVYPRSTPGGWHLLGRTSESLFDPHRPPHSRVAPGDRVRFVEAGAGADLAPPAADGVRPSLAAPAGPALEVTDAGLLDLVQDAGRPGVARLGVPRAGAADPRALELVNLLLGNGPGAAAVEVTGTGPSVGVVGSGHIAVVGPGAGTVEVRVDGRPVADAAVVPVRDGQVVSVGRVTGGLRAYLGVAGGLETPELLGSRSSDVLSGLGAGPLRAGDRLARGEPARARGRLHLPSGTIAGATTVRVVAGPHARGDDGSGDDRFRRLLATAWRVAADLDRIGVRLEAADGAGPEAGGPVASTPMVTGAVQLPPDGRPIILLPDHATVGGYPVVACVIAADLSVLGQLAPADTVAFVPVDQDAAAEALARYWAARDAAVAGWFPTVAGT